MFNCIWNCISISIIFGNKISCESFYSFVLKIKLYEMKLDMYQQLHSNPKILALFYCQQFTVLHNIRFYYELKNRLFDFWDVTKTVLCWQNLRFVINILNKLPQLWTIFLREDWHSKNIENIGWPIENIHARNTTLLCDNKKLNNIYTKVPSLLPYRDLYVYKRFVLILIFKKY